MLAHLIKLCITMQSIILEHTYHFYKNWIKTHPPGFTAASSCNCSLSSGKAFCSSTVINPVFLGFLALNLGWVPFGRLVVCNRSAKFYKPYKLWTTCKSIHLDTISILRYNTKRSLVIGFLTFSFLLCVSIPRVSGSPCVLFSISVGCRLLLTVFCSTLYF